MERTVWTKHGWITIPATEEVKKHIVASRRLTRIKQYSADYEQSNNKDFYSLYQDINTSIQAGTPGYAIDELPNSYRFLYQDTTRMYVTKNANAVLMKESTEEQHNTGSFKEDKDEELENEMANLEKEGLVNWTSVQEDVDTIRDFVQEEQIRRRTFIVEDYEDLISAAEESGDLELIEEYVISCTEELKNVPTEKEFSYMLNSGVTGKGYRSSDSGYKKVDSRFSQDGSIMAEIRHQNFKQNLHEMTMCRTKKDIWGTPLNKENGIVEFIGGFMAKLRELYAMDKILWETWNPDNKAKARKLFISKWRHEFCYGNNGKGNPLKDEVSLKKALYFRFDMTSSDNLDQYDKDSNKVVKGVRRKASIWDRDKAKAFNNLYMTRDQWSAIYRMKDIMLHRIDMDRNGFDEERNIAIEELRDAFRAIETLEDLRSYSCYAHRRTWKKRIFDSRDVKTIIKTNTGEEKTMIRTKKTYMDTCTFELSLIDRISIQDEINWVTSMRRLGKVLSKKEKKEEQNG